MTWSNATVLFHFEKPNGNPAEGSVTFTSNSVLVLNPATHVTWVGPQTFALDETGAVSVSIPPTDTDEIAPATNRQWKIAVRLEHSNRVMTIPGIALASGQTYHFDELVEGVEASPVFNTWLSEEQYDALVARVDGLSTPAPIGFDTDGTPYLTIGA